MNAVKINLLAICCLFSLSSMFAACQPVRPGLGLWVHPRATGYEELKSWLPALAERGASLLAAVDQDQIEDRDPLMADLLRAAHAHGVEIRAWILMDYEDGYYPNAENVEAFSALVESMIRWVEEESLPLEWITVDMETSIHVMTHMNRLLMEGKYLEALQLILGQVDREAHEAALAGFSRLIRTCHDHGFKVHVVTFPQVLDDHTDGDPALQDALNIPVHPLPFEAWDDVDFMVYRSEMAGISGFSMGPELITTYARDAVALFGDRATLSLGIVGPDGTHDNYNTPGELIPDVNAALAGGLRRVNLFSLTGALSMPEPESWLDVEAPAFPPPRPDLPSRGFRLLFKLLDGLLD